MSGFRVERAGPDAIDAIMPVMAAAFDPQFGEAWSAAQCRGMMTLPGAHLLVARTIDDENVAGFALTRNIVGEAELLLIAVAPEMQKLGIGRALLDEVIRDALQQGSGRIFLEMREGNTATRLYEDVGFVQVGRRSGYYRGANGVLRDALTFEFCR